MKGCTALLSLLVLLFSAPVFAAEDVFSHGSSQSLRARVEFWKLIFTKYGRNQVVFHWREHPGVIYSVLDFSAGITAPAKARRARYNAEEIETDRIRATLRRLAREREVSDPFGRRLKRLFHSFGLDRPAHYERAAEVDQIRSQSGVRELFRDGLVRSTRYLFAIERMLKQHGLPLELGRLPFVESSYDYTAYSSVGAAGIWQFMRGTGKQYLRIDNVIDERRDPIQSTRAAIQYLSRAHEVLGAWPLAVTSYNHGITGVLRAVKETGSRDLQVIIQRFNGTRFGFASENFYAEFLAAIEVERDWQRYFPGLRREPPQYFEEIEVLRRISWSGVVKHLPLSRDQFQTMNPHLLSPVWRRGVAIPPGVVLKVPFGSGKQLLAALGKTVRIYSTSGPLKERRVSKPAVQRSGRKVFGGKVRQGGTTTYTVRAGDTLGSIARKFSVSSASLAKSNGIQDPKQLRLGKKLRIPGR